MQLLKVFKDESFVCICVVLSECTRFWCFSECFSPGGCGVLTTLRYRVNMTCSPTQQAVAMCPRILYGEKLLGAHNT